MLNDHTYFQANTLFQMLTKTLQPNTEYTRIIPLDTQTDSSGLPKKSGWY